MPGGHDPEIRRDVDRRKLRLGQTHPVLLRHLADAQHLTAGKKVLQLQKFLRLIGGGPLLEQSHDAAALPAFLGRRHARFTKQRLFGIGLGISIFDRDAERIQRIERVAHVLDPVFRAHQAQLVHDGIP